MHPIPLGLIFAADYRWSVESGQSDIAKSLERESGYTWDGQRVLENDRPVAVTRRRNTDWVVLHLHDVPVSRIASFFAMKIRPSAE